MKFMNVNDKSYEPLVTIDEEDPQPLKKAKTASSSGGRGRSGSCLSCCCRCMLITILLIFTMMTVVTILAYGWISKVVHDFTVTTPLPYLPVVDMSDEDVLALQERMTRFSEDDNKEDLIITQDEMNGLICRCETLRGNAFVALEEGLIYEKYSIPTDMLPGGEGRFFVAHDYVKMYNGDHIEMNMETAATHHDWFDGPLLFAQLQYMVNEKDMLELFLEKGSFFGKEATQDFIDQRVNLLDGTDAAYAHSAIESVSIHPGKIIVHPRKNTMA